MDAKEEIVGAKQSERRTEDVGDLDLSAASLGPTLGAASLRIVDVEVLRCAEEGAVAMSGPELAGRLIARLIGTKDREHFVSVHLDARHRPVGMSVVSVGTLSSSLVHPREVFKAAILSNAAAIIIGHNHPSGSLQPSREDRAVHDRISKAGELLGIPVLDSFIVCGRRAMSMNE